MVRQAKREGMVVVGVVWTIIAIVVEGIRYG